MDMTTQMQVLLLYFKKYEGLSCGLHFACNAFGCVVWPVLIQYLFTVYSWQGTMLLIAAVHMNSLAIMLFIPARLGCNDAQKQKVMEREDICIRDDADDCENERGTVKADTNAIRPERLTDKTDNVQEGIFSHLRNTPLLIHLCAMCLCYYGHGTAFGFIPSLGLDHGLNKNEASSLVSIMAAATIIGRPLMGYLCDRRTIAHRRCLVYGATFMCYGSCNALAAFATGYVPMAVVMAIMGFGGGK